LASVDASRMPMWRIRGAATRVETRQDNIRFEAAVWSTGNTRKTRRQCRVFGTDAGWQLTIKGVALTGFGSVLASGASNIEWASDLSPRRIGASACQSPGQGLYRKVWSIRNA